MMLTKHLCGVIISCFFYQLSLQIVINRFVIVVTIGIQAGFILFKRVKRTYIARCTVVGILKRKRVLVETARTKNLSLLRLFLKNFRLMCQFLLLVLHVCNFSINSGGHGGHICRHVKESKRRNLANKSELQSVFELFEGLFLLSWYCSTELLEDYVSTIVPYMNYCYHGTLKSTHTID